MFYDFVISIDHEVCFFSFGVDVSNHIIELTLGKSSFITTLV